MNFLSGIFGMLYASETSSETSSETQNIIDWELVTPSDDFGEWVLTHSLRKHTKPREPCEQLEQRAPTSHLRIATLFTVPVVSAITTSVYIHPLTSINALMFTLIKVGIAPGTSALISIEVVNILSALNIAKTLLIGTATTVALVLQT